MQIFANKIDNMSNVRVCHNQVLKYANERPVKNRIKKKKKKNHQQIDTSKQPWEYDQVCYQVIELEYKYLMYISNE